MIWHLNNYKYSMFLPSRASEKILIENTTGMTWIYTLVFGLFL